MELYIIDDGSALRVSNRLNRYAHRAQDTYSVMQAIAKDMLLIEGIVFSSGGRRGGGSWARLKPDTVRKKGSVEILRTGSAREGYSDPGHDALFESLTVEDAPGQVMNITNRGIEFGTEVKAAGIMQSGNAQRNIPARPMLRFLESDIARWDAMIIEHLMAVD